MWNIFKTVVRLSSSPFYNDYVFEKDAFFSSVVSSLFFWKLIQFHALTILHAQVLEYGYSEQERDLTLSTARLQSMFHPRTFLPWHEKDEFCVGCVFPTLFPCFSQVLPVFIGYSKDVNELGDS